MLLYTPDFEIEGIIATNSVWQKDGHGTGWILDLIDRYEQVRPNLLLHDPDYPEAASLREVVMLGNEDRNKMHEVGPDHDSPGSQHIIDVLLDDDPRPVWVQAWGGTNTIAQALWRLRESHSGTDFQKAVDKIRIYAIADQDSTIWWIRDEVPDALLILNYQFVSINYQHEGHPYSDSHLFSKEWMQEHVKEDHGPLGAAYPQEYFSEGDSPAFFYLIANGLRATENPGYGGWGGRFIPVQNRFWKDALDDGDWLKPLWRWLPALSNDFAARLDWCVRPYDEANHAPDVILQGQAGLSPLHRTASAGETLALSATGTSDPDGDALTYRWWVYREAGTYPGDVTIHASDSPEARIEIPANLDDHTIHVILEVTDDGTPALSSYRRVVLSASS